MVSAIFEMLLLGKSAAVSLVSNRGGTGKTCSICEAIKLLGLMMPRKNNKVKSIIVSAPGAMQASLRAVLKGEETVEVIGCVGGGLSASVIIREQQPDVVLIDSNLPEDEMLALVRKIKDETPEIRCVVLTDTRHRERQAQIAGADVVLSQGRGVGEIIKAMKGGSITP